MNEANTFSYNTNEEAIKKAKEIIRSKDCVLIKASLSCRFREIVVALK